jgi:hypothetical protein
MPEPLDYEPGSRRRRSINNTIVGWAIILAIYFMVLGLVAFLSKRISNL